MHSAPKPQRIITVDALSGIAMFGILLAHMCFWYNAGPSPDEFYGKYTGIVNQIVSILNDVIISGKFFAFFSFLFGLSFYLQMERMEQKSTHFAWRYAWRIALMGIIGLVQFFQPMVPPVKGAPKTSFDTESKAFLAIVQGKSWLNIWVDNLKKMGTKFDFQFASGRIYITFGFFLLGMYAGRLNWFNDILLTKYYLQKILKRSCLLAIGLLLLGIGIILSNELSKLGWQENRTVGLVFGTIYDLFNAALVMVYITGFTLLLNKNSWERISGWFASIGKMALTSYLLQTLVGLLLFYGVGLGLTGKEK